MNEDKKPEYIAIDQDEEIGGNSSFVPLEDGAINRAYIESVRRIHGTDFDGNPNIQLVFGLKEASTGQVYNFYANETLGEKAKLSAFLKEVLGEVRRFKTPELLGLPLQFTVRPSKNNPERQVPDKILKPAKDQTRTEIKQDVVPTDIDPNANLDAELEKVFGNTEVVSE